MNIKYLIQYFLYNLEAPIELGSLVGDIEGAHFTSASNIPTTLLYPGKMVYEVMDVEIGGIEVPQQTWYIVDKDKALIPIIQGNKILKEALDHDSITELLNENSTLAKMVRSDKVAHGAITVSAALPIYRKRVYYPELGTGSLTISGLLIHPFQIVVNRLVHTCVFGADPGIYDFSYAHSSSNTVITPNPGISPSVAFNPFDTVDLYFRLSETLDYVS
jgi:hypothetical protein